MKKQLLFFTRLTTVILIGISLIGCATTVPIKSIKTPTIDTSNIRNMAVRPFEDRSGSGNTGVQLARDITQKVTQIIDATGRFTKVSVSDPNADGIFTGEIRELTENEFQDSRTVTGRDGKQYIETKFNREVSLTFSYTIINGRTGLPIREVVKQGTQTASSDSQTGLASVLEIANKIVDSQLSKLESDIVPTIVSTNKTLAKETSKDKVVKQKMKDTLLLVKSNNYEEAIRQYDAIATEHGSTAAKANAAILRESIASDITATAGLAQLESERGSLSDKAIEAAAQELYAKLPANSVIIVMEANSQDRIKLEEIVNNINSTIVSEGIFKVVDRSLIMQTEMQYQASGLVSDDSYVEFGKHYGAQYIVLFEITGQMSSRQLNMKVISIETSEIMSLASFAI